MPSARQLRLTIGCPGRGCRRGCAPELGRSIGDHRSCTVRARFFHPFGNREGSWPNLSSCQLIRKFGFPYQYDVCSLEGDELAVDVEAFPQRKIPLFTTNLSAHSRSVRLPKMQGRAYISGGRAGLFL
jgi:hypothetical protein